VFDDNGAGYHPEAWDLFRAAEVIVAPHGSALSHAVATRPGALVVEVIHPDYLNPCFAHASVKLGLKHHYVLDKEAYTKKEDLHVDIDSIIQIIQQAIQQAQQEAAAHAL